ncbi:MAG TPA: ornithine--oxo-acid transaminase [Mycobacteriales bacterium]|jgi:ornithine--oxo-acid transaminase|nr:ornithine--oxo-acid transaminase [Mycobacteriales bacterium]
MSISDTAYDTASAIAEAAEHAAHNYHPLPVVIAAGEGAWVTDITGRSYVDMLAGYSSLNFGHRHPALVQAAIDQLGLVTLTSRAFHHDKFAQFTGELAELCGMDMVLPMNTGAEAVETGLKTARKWGYQVKGVPANQATIIVCGGNFHGRTISIVSFSDDPSARDGFGPFTPGFVQVPYDDLEAVAAAIDDTTVAVLVEPIQGESGVVIPGPGYLRGLRDLCSANNVLFIADEIQSGLGRTGMTFACDHENVRPDMYLLGKALGGGIVPVSAVVANRDVLGVFAPGEHGSTFGGNPMACAVGLAVVRLVRTGEFQERARELGAVLAERLSHLAGITSFRSRGLWAGVDIAGRTGRDVCEGLLTRGILAKDTHGSTIRLAPPLVITRHDLEWALDQLATELR